MKADRRSLVTPAFSIEEAAEVTDRVDPPTRVFDVALKLTALIPPQDQSFSGTAFSEDDSEPRAIHRIDQQTNKGAALLVRQVNPKKVL